MAAVFLVLLGGAALAAPPWSDAPDSFWTETYGVTDTQVGAVASGYSDGTFRPNQPVTRAEFAKMAVSGLGIATQNPASPTFIDVLPGSTFYIYVEGAYAAGLVKGETTSAGKVFGPDTDISRQRTNSILGRYLSGKELEVTGVITGIFGGEAPGSQYASLEYWYDSEGFGQLTRFTDAADVLPAHTLGTAYLVFRDVVKGSAGMLEPQAKLSRSQAAAVVLRVRGVSFTPKPPVVFGLEPRSGPVAGGTTVVISGYGFTGATTVTFGGTSASGFHVDNNAQITAVAPAQAAGIVDVVITTPYGESADTGSDDYTYAAE
jgi:hypothetical protein